MAVDYFTEDNETGWDGRIYMRSIPDKLDVLELTAPLPCGDGFVPEGFRWDGSSAGPLRKLTLFGFPKWRHPIASCRHDWRCLHAASAAQRKFADKQFKKDVANGGTKWETCKGYIGVRIGAFFGVGSDF